MVRRVKAYLRNVDAMLIEDEKELLSLSEKCEPPPQPTQSTLTSSSSLINIQVSSQIKENCQK